MNWLKHLAAHLKADETQEYINKCRDEWEREIPYAGGGAHYQKCVIEATLWKKKKRASPRAAAPRPKDYRPR